MGGCFRVAEEIRVEVKVEEFTFQSEVDEEEVRNDAYNSIAKLIPFNADDKSIRVENLKDFMQILINTEKNMIISLKSFKITQFIKLREELNLENLNISDAELYELSGYLSNLDHLFITSENITSIPHIESLKTVYCQNCPNLLSLNALNATRIDCSSSSKLKSLIIPNAINNIFL